MFIRAGYPECFLRLQPIQESAKAGPEVVRRKTGRGKVRPATCEMVRSWLGELPAGGGDFAVEATTGLRLVVEELVAGGVTAHLAEPAATSAARVARSSAPRPTVSTRATSGRCWSRPVCPSHRFHRATSWTCVRRSGCATLADARITTSGSNRECQLHLAPPCQLDLAPPGLVVSGLAVTVCDRPGWRWWVGSVPFSGTPVLGGAVVPGGAGYRGAFRVVGGQGRWCRRRGVCGAGAGSPRGQVVASLPFAFGLTAAGRSRFRSGGCGR